MGRQSSKRAKRSGGRRRAAPAEEKELPLFAAAGGGPEGDPAASEGGDGKQATAAVRAGAGEAAGGDAEPAKPAESTEPSSRSRWLRITPTRADRLLVVWIATALTVWLCCLVMLWTWALDPSGTTTLEAMTAALLGVTTGMRLCRPLARLGRRVLGWLGLRNVLAVDLRGTSGVWVGTDDIRAMIRLLGAVALFCGLCGLVSTLAVSAGEKLVDWLTRRLLWTPGEWAVLKFALALAGMVPIGAAVATAFLASAMVRSGSGRDPYAMVCREWLAAAALGLAVFAVAWRLGVHLLGAALMTGVALVAAAVALFQRPQGRPRPRRVSQKPGGASAGPRAAVVAVVAGLALGFGAQLRLLGDAIGADSAGRAVWLAASLWLMARFLVGEDRKPRAVGRAQAMGASVGAISLLGAQAMLGGAAVSAGREGNAWGYGLLVALAGLAQIPAMAMVAVVVSRGRTVFARAGGSPGAYMGSVAGGASAGLGVFLLAAGSAAGRLAVLVLAAAAVLYCAGTSVVASRQRRQRRQWALLGVLVVGVSVGGLAASYRAAGPLAVGTWLTAADSPSRDGSPAVGGVVPVQPWRAAGVSSAMAEVLARPEMRGRWWVISPGGAELPSPLPAEVWVTASSADAGMAAGSAWRRRPGGSGGSYPAQTRIGRGRVDGIVLAPLAADHPQAWRCYNRSSLDRCRDRRLNRRGVLLVRTTAARRRLGRAMAVAKTFRRVFGSGWAVLGFGPERVDVLLGGPAELAPAPMAAHGAYVVDLRRLIALAPGVRGVELVRPGASRGAAVDAEEIEARLRSQDGR